MNPGAKIVIVIAIALITLAGVYFLIRPEPPAQSPREAFEAARRARLAEQNETPAAAPSESTRPPTNMEESAARDVRTDQPPVVSGPLAQAEEPAVQPLGGTPRSAEETLAERHFNWSAARGPEIPPAGNADDVSIAWDSTEDDLPYEPDAVPIEEWMTLARESSGATAGEESSAGGFSESPLRAAREEELGGSNATSEISTSRPLTREESIRILTGQAPPRDTSTPAVPRPADTRARNAGAGGEDQWHAYTVRKDDTLAAVSKWWFGSEQYWSLIVEANPGVDPNRLQIGQRIVLPPKERATALRTSTPEQPASAGARTYTVKSGDTLTKIARVAYGDGARWKEIYEANRAVIGPTPDSLEVGMQLTIP